MAVGLLHTPLGIALLQIFRCNLGFTDKAGLSLLCWHKRRLFTNRTHVQRYRYLGFYTCSWYIIIRCLLGLPTGFEAASLISFNCCPQTVDNSIARFS